MENNFTYPTVLKRTDKMFTEAKRISHDSAIFSGRKALLEKHFNEHPIYLDISYYAQSDEWPQVVRHDDDFKGEPYGGLSNWRDCHYYTLYEYQGHRFFIMEGGKYD